MTRTTFLKSLSMPLPSGHISNRRAPRELYVLMLHSSGFSSLSSLLLVESNDLYSPRKLYSHFNMIRGTNVDGQASPYATVEEKGGFRLIWIQCVLLDVEIAGIVSWLNPRSTHFAQSHGVVGFPLMPSHSAVFRCRPGSTANWSIQWSC